MSSLMRGAFFALLFFYSSQIFAHPFDHEWLSLLRYNRYGTSYQSEADSPVFFLTNNGKNDPRAEYYALVKEMQTPINDDNHPACLFPARTLKVFADGNLPQAPDFKNCQRLQQYLRATNARAASLVFAGYFIQRPSSAFGHTFLRLHTNQQGNAALLDFAVDYAANVDTNNPLMYGVKGILGGFNGRFSRMPYFLKLREYADLDSRDIWEYELKLNQQQVNLLVLHLWEMDQAFFDYYYFSENCSYHILRAIEAVSSQKIAKKLKFFVTPLDTLQALDDVDLLKTPLRRPSQYSIVKASLDQLSDSQLKLAHQFLKDPLNYHQELPNQAIVLDAFIEILNYKFAQELLTDTARPAVHDLRQEILIKRSKSDEQYSQPKVGAAINPASGHRGSWFDIAFMHSQSKNTLRLEHAVALHAFNHPEAGFSSRFQMVMGKLALNLRPEEILIDEAIVFEVISASHSFDWEFKPSWRLALGAQRTIYSNEKLRTYALLSSGVSLSFVNDLMVMINLDAKPRHNPLRDEKVSLPLGPSLLINLSLNYLRVGFESFYYREVFSKDDEFLLAPFVRYSLSPNSDAFVRSQFERAHTKTYLGLTYFY